MQKWEYYTATFQTERFQNYIDIEWLNGFGAEGWEIVSIHHTATSSDWENTYLVIFKRPKHEQLTSDTRNDGAIGISDEGGSTQTPEINQGPMQEGQS